MKDPLTLLWVDDDGVGRFAYEIDCLARMGWKTVWATGAEEAASTLSTSRYDLVLLDQVFPFRSGDSYRDVWTGCRLLYWLRGRGVPPDAPQREAWLQLTKSVRPHKGNKDAPVIIVSAFQDEHVDAALSAVIPPKFILPKPVDENILLQRVKELGYKRH